MSSYSTTQLAPPSGREDYRPRSSEDYLAGRSSDYSRGYSRDYAHSPTDSPRTPTDYARPFSSADYARDQPQQPFPSIPAAHRAPIGNTIRPEKPKGWIRRLSMPVVGRSSSSQSLTKLLDGGKPAGGQGPGKRGELGAVAEDGVLGERRSYYVPGNRSYTNLARR